MGNGHLGGVGRGQSSHVVVGVELEAPTGTGPKRGKLGNWRVNGSGAEAEASLRKAPAGLRPLLVIKVQSSKAGKAGTGFRVKVYQNLFLR